MFSALAQITRGSSLPVGHLCSLPRLCFLTYAWAWSWGEGAGRHPEGTQWMVAIYCGWKDGSSSSRVARQSTGTRPGEAVLTFRRMNSSSKVDSEGMTHGIWVVLGDTWQNLTPWAILWGPGWHASSSTWKCLRFSLNRCSDPGAYALSFLSLEPSYRMAAHVKIPLQVIKILHSQ